MKRFVIPVVVSVVIVVGGLGVSWSAPGAEALSQPTNTPPAPGDGGFVYQAVPSSVKIPVQEHSDGAVVEAVIEEGHGRSAEALRQTGMRFSTPSTGGDLSPQDFRVYCQDMLLNPQMDVEVFPTAPPTGSADPWELFWPVGYFSTNYHSAPYSLAMADDNDPYSPFTWDYDALGQAFYAPSGLMTITVKFSGYHLNVNDGDDAWVNLFALDDEGNFDTLVTYGLINYPSSGVWVNWTWTITNPTTLAALSGGPDALVFDMENDRGTPNEWFYVDDAQLNLCFGLDVTSEVYLPLVKQSPIPTCAPREPDSRDAPGSTAIGATCSGSFSPLDTKDYYSLDPNGVRNVRLWLRNLPAGTNWGAAIFVDNPANTYVCHIGTPGSGDKSVNCTLDPSKHYFVKVDAGTAPGSTQTYQMSVVAR
jgi:hypothetical protein